MGKPKSKVDKKWLTEPYPRGYFKAVDKSGAQTSWLDATKFVWVNVPHNPKNIKKYKKRQLGTP